VILMFIASQDRYCILAEPCGEHVPRVQSSQIERCVKATKKIRTHALMVVQAGARAAFLISALATVLLG